jgi:3',5'-cyclic AMP phosphodiesterase CpdA
MTRLAFVALALFAALACNSSTGPAPDPSAPAYSFVVIGCNRVDKADTTGNASTANVEQLERTFSDIAAMQPRPDLVFFAGDLVLGYTADTVLLESQLRGWRALYEASPLAATSTELVVIPGNHEVQNASKIAYAAGERVWLRVMAPYLKRGGNGPRLGGMDNLQTDQSMLSYSFDFRDTHFLALDSDPVGADWHVPTKWIAADAAAARAAGAKHLFAIAHKPAFGYPTVATDGLGIDAPARDAFWNVLTANHAEAMIAAHNHVYWRARPTSFATWQVIAGNGGSLLEPTLDMTIPSTGNYFGFTVTTVTNDGHVFLRSYGRNVPAAGYTASAAAYPTTVRDSIDLTWK